MRAKFQIVRGPWTEWKELFEEAARKATEIGRDRLIGFSQSEDRNEGVLTIWYWERKVEAPRTGWQVKFRVFRGLCTAWQTIYGETAQFLGEVGGEQLIGVSQSEDKGDSVVAVWYWENTTA